jgi:hypothetical protein
MGIIGWQEEEYFAIYAVLRLAQVGTGWREVGDGLAYCDGAQ